MFETTQEGCQGDTNSIDILVTDINGLGSNPPIQFSISPNPSEGLVQVKFVDHLPEKISITDLNGRVIDEVEIKVKQVGHRSGDLHVKQMPQGSTCNDIKAYLKNYEIETQKRPDVLIVDYLDLLFPNNKRIDPGNLFVKDKFVSEALWGLLVERQMIGQTAAQLNRGAV